MRVRHLLIAFLVAAFVLGVTKAARAPIVPVLVGTREAMELKLWDVDSRKEHATLFHRPLADGDSGVFEPGHFSRDGNYVAIRKTGPRTIENWRVWDTETGEELKSIPNDQHPWLRSLDEDRVTLGEDRITMGSGKFAFSPDRKCMATAGKPGNRTIRLIDVATGNELAVLEGHRYRVRSLTYSDDGKLLFSIASFEQTLFQTRDGPKPSPGKPDEEEREERDEQRQEKRSAIVVGILATGSAFVVIGLSFLIYGWVARLPRA